VDQAVWIFIILHLLVYPASNAFNSYNDQDTGSIGGLISPPPSNNKVLHLANLLDVIAITISAIFINLEFAFLILIYVSASRLYSYRRIRIKKYPILGFLTVFIFQGGFTFIMCLYGLGEAIKPAHWIAAIAASFQIGAVYPISQIYQHESDRKDGVTTLSAKLGYTGTFIFSATCFLIATTCYFFYFQQSPTAFLLLVLMQLPLIIAFTVWFLKVSKSTTQANFRNTMRFNVLASITFNLYYTFLILLY
jgi:1,4-dihydroxy-2-naphthoate octaprenyltransferase